MEECRTPTYSEHTQFKFACTTPTNLDMQNMQNLMVSNSKKPRCYTPTADTSFKSPCMSPIELEQNADNQQMKPACAMPMPKPPMPKHHRTKVAAMNLATGKMKPMSPLAMSAVAPAHNSNGVSIVVSPNLDNSATDSANSSGGGDKSMLNHTLSIDTMLQSIHMQQYAGIFNDCTVEAFLKMRKSDLQRFGLNCEEHCQKIMDMLKDFNNNNAN